MTTLRKLWVQHEFGKNRVLRIDWSWKNDRHQRVEIAGNTPQALERALREAADLVSKEIAER